MIFYKEIERKMQNVSISDSDHNQFKIIIYKNSEFYFLSNWYPVLEHIRSVNELIIL